MSTGSTRSSRRRAANRQRLETHRPAPAEPPAKGDGAVVTAGGRWPQISSRAFWVLAVAILLVATMLRVYALSLNPFHHDEGINGWFVTNLVRRGEWEYDPANYHGPTLFYFALVAQTLLGLTDEAMRLVPALFGVATIGLTLLIRPFVGPLAALTAAALLAVSPGATYVSRYFIHESLVVFFTLALVLAVLYLLRGGRQRFLVLAAASVALLLATKETGIVSLAVLAIAAGVGLTYMKLRHPSKAEAEKRSRKRRASGGCVPPDTARPAGRSLITPAGAAASATVFVVLYGLLFSSLLSNPQGLVDSLATFTIWTQTGTESQVQPIQQYLVWMLQADAPILILGAVGGLFVAWRAHNRVAVFIALWALGITAAYSLVTYKTPWIALNMLVPLALVGGIGASLMARHLRSRPLRAAAAAVLAGAIGVSGYQALDINFVHFDDENYPYVFVHTTRQALALVAETDRIGRFAGTAADTGIVVVSPDYWPLPWYYRNQPRATFFGEIVPTEEPMVIANVNQDAELAEVLGGRYRRTQVYTLRPGVDLALYVRADMADL